MSSPTDVCQVCLPPPPSTSPPPHTHTPLQLDPDVLFYAGCFCGDMPKVNEFANKHIYREPFYSAVKTIKKFLFLIAASSGKNKNLGKVHVKHMYVTPCPR